MRWIYISPHLDDAALSTGGLIYEQTRAGQAVEIWTMMSGFPPPGELTPLAQSLHALWGTGSAEDTVRLRRQEDLKAGEILGAKMTHFDLPDCIYRRAPNGEALYLDIFVSPREEEAALPAQMAQALAARLGADDVAVCPLGLGGHVDHLLVRLAVERLGRRLYYLADLPYLFKQPETLTAATVGMKVSRHPITEAGLWAWLEAISAYSSQLSALFDAPDEVEGLLRAYVREWEGVPLWKSE